MFNQSKGTVKIISGGEQHVLSARGGRELGICKNCQRPVWLPWGELGQDEPHVGVEMGWQECSRPVVQL